MASERRESTNEWPSLPISLAVKQGENGPVEKDWKDYQGGMPTVIQARVAGSGAFIYYVFHNYLNPKDPAAEGAIVATNTDFIKKAGTTHNISYKDERGEIIKTVGFPVCLSWWRHGNPCEKNAGERYNPRIKSENLEKWLAGQSISSYRIIPGTNPIEFKKRK